MSEKHPRIVGAAGLGLRLVAWLLASLIGAQAQVVADLASDFSYSANPNGQWRYGYSATQNGAGTAHPLKFNWGLQLWTPAPGGASYTPYIARNTTGSTVNFTPTTGGLDVPVAAGAVIIHPGPEFGAYHYSFAEWTVNITGVYALAGSFVNADTTNGGATVDAAVLLNGSVLGSGTVNSGASFFYNPGSLALTNGDVIRFAVGSGGNGYFHDIVQLSATISAVPEPSTYAALAGLGALAFVAWRRRRVAAAP
jgi:hypothetical protein